MGIKRLSESGGADEGGEYHGYRKLAASATPSTAG
jgi:hypothetical protein